MEGFHLEHKNFDVKMKKLKATYDELPTQTDKERIMRQIRDDKKPKYPFQIFRYAGVAISFCLFILLALPFFNQEIKNQGTVEEDFVLSLSDVKVEIYSDESKFGSIDIGNDKHIPTVIEYQLTLHNEGNQSIGSLSFDKEKNQEQGLRIEIEPQEPLRQSMLDVFGQDIINGNDLGNGATGDSRLKADKKGSFTRYYLLGTEDDISGLPKLPPKGKLNELENNALYADVIVYLGENRIARFDLSDYITLNSTIAEKEAWRESPKFSIPVEFGEEKTPGEYGLVGKEGKFGIQIGSGEKGELEYYNFIANVPNKNMWYFWKVDEAMSGNLKVFATDEYGKKHPVLMKNGYSSWDTGYGIDSVSQNNENEIRLHTGMIFPSAGQWKLDVYFGDKWYDELFITVEE